MLPLRCTKQPEANLVLCPRSFWHQTAVLPKNWKRHSSGLKALVTSVFDKTINRKIAGPAINYLTNCREMKPCFNENL